MNGSQIAEAANVPKPFLAKILLQLKKAGLVLARKGPGGGYALARKPENITLQQISLVMDQGFPGSRQCILGLERCMDQHPCPLHHRWRDFRQDVETKLKSLNIKEFAHLIEEKQAHLRLPEAR